MSTAVPPMVHPCCRRASATPPSWSLNRTRAVLSNTQAEWYSWTRPLQWGPRVSVSTVLRRLSEERPVFLGEVPDSQEIDRAIREVRGRLDSICQGPGPKMVIWPLSAKR